MFIKRITAFILIIILYLNVLTACKSQKEIYSQIQYTNVYKTLYLEVPDNNYILDRIYTFNDIIYAVWYKVIYKYDELKSEETSNFDYTDYLIYKYSIAGETIEIIQLDLGINEYNFQIIPYTDDTVYVITETCVFNSTYDGTIIWEISFFDAFNVRNIGIIIPYLDIETKYLYILSYDDLLVLTVTGELVHSFKTNDYIDIIGYEYSVQIIKEYDGNIIFKYGDSACAVNINSKEIMEYEMPEVPSVLGRVYGTISYLPNYDNNYDIYYSNYDGFYGYNTNEIEPVMLINWINSDIDFMRENYKILSVITHELVLCVFQENGYKLALLKHVPDDELIRKTIITIASMFSDSSIISAAVKFNKLSDKYRVVIDDYSLYNKSENNLPITDMFNLDIISGVVHDIVYSTKYMPIDSYINKDMFVDLYELLDTDPDTEISSDNILGIIKSAYETNGHLYILPVSYYIMTMFGKPSIVGAKESLTIDEIMEINNNLPNDTSLFTFHTRDDIFLYILQAGANDYIDYKTYTCDFTSDNFIKMIEFVKMLPNTSIANIYDYMSQQEILDIIRNNQSYFYDYRIMNVSTLFTMKYYYGEEGYVIKGFPNNTGNGSIIESVTYLSINSKSNHREGAWEFLKFWLSDEMQSYNSYNLPVTNSALQYIVNKYMNMYWYVVNNELELSIETLPKYEEYHFEEDDVVKIFNYFNSINVTPKYNDTVINIIQEEITQFFADAITAEQCAGYIQNRVQLYLNEQK